MSRTIKALIIYSLVLSLVVFDFSPNAYPDAGPSANQLVVISAVGCACIGGALLAHRFFRSEEHEPVTGVLFDAEDVFINISGDSMRVDAVFEYQNTTKKRLRMDLFFPFTKPVNGSIQDIAVILSGMVSSQDRKLEYTIDGSRIYFTFIIEPIERVALKVHYREMLTGKRADYIITTIKRWQRPVARASFTV